MIAFSQKNKLILSDVDETIADVYTDATPEMIHELANLLKSGRILFMVTGAGLGSVKERIIDHLDPFLRKQIIVAHCSGAEIIGFDNHGELMAPYYSIYADKMTSEQQMSWRSIVDQVIDQYDLIKVNPQKVANFKAKYGDHPLTVMLADRGPQITLEFVNGYQVSKQQYNLVKSAFPNLKPKNDYYDLRETIAETFNQLLAAAKLPVSAHLAGVFALDLILDGVSKTVALDHVLHNHEVLSNYGLPTDILNHPEYIEIWGDKFTKNGGSDRKMFMALDPKTRAIDFRPEPKEELGNEYNIVLWDGKKQLHEGLLEYLQSSTIN